MGGLGGFGFWFLVLALAALGVLVSGFWFWLWLLLGFWFLVSGFGFGWSLLDSTAWHHCLTTLLDNTLSKAKPQTTDRKPQTTNHTEFITQPLGL